MSKQTRTIAIDFDGVLHRYSGYRGGVIDGPIKGARSAIGSLMRQGHTVVVFTTRDNAMVTAWLAEHGFPPLHVTSHKDPFWVIVDDRALRFEGVWDEAFVRSIVKSKPYWIGGNPAEAEV